MLAIDYIERIKIPSHEQEGFRTGRSCARAIIHLGLCVEDAHAQNYIVLCYLDFKGAFPSTDHAQPVRILTFLGHHIQCLQWGHNRIYHPPRTYVPHWNSPRYNTGRPHIPTPFRPHDRTPHMLAQGFSERLRNHILGLQLSSK
jgi:hypothetical protein